MSDFSEELHEAILKHVTAKKGEASEVPLDADKKVEEAALRGVRMVKETCHFHDNEITKCIRRAYHKVAGSAPFESPSDARERTEPYLLPSLVGSACNALADGIQMGRKDSRVYKKYKTLRKLEAVLSAPGFREASDVLVMGYQTDQDTVDVVKHYIESVMHHLGISTGYAHHDPEGTSVSIHNVNKIWELWLLSMRSVVIGLYLTGYHMGEEQVAEERRKKEEEEFQGIISASTGTSDG